MLSSETTSASIQCFIRKLEPEAGSAVGGLNGLVVTAPSSVNGLHGAHAKKLRAATRNLLCRGPGLTGTTLGITTARFLSFLPNSDVPPCLKICILVLSTPFAFRMETTLRARKQDKFML